jgi:hypothetical protein
MEKPFFLAIVFFISQSTSVQPAMNPISNQWIAETSRPYCHRYTFY